MTLKTMMFGRIWPGFMPSRNATEHGQWQPRKGRESEACLGKSQTTEEATVMWCGVEVCGFGVQLPRSNLAATWVSKNSCSTFNVLPLWNLHHRCLNISEMTCNEVDFNPS